MTSFGDGEPEDAWDPDDPVDELVDNLRRRVEAIIALQMVDAVVERRLGWLGDDLDAVAARIRAGLYSRIER